MTTRFQLISAAKLAPGKMQCFEVYGKRIILANVAGDFFATDEMCSHEEFSLAYGALKDYQLECSLHGSCFDVRTGKPSAEPATAAIQTYATQVDDGIVYVLLDESGIIAKT